MLGCFRCWSTLACCAAVAACGARSSIDLGGRGGDMGDGSVGATSTSGGAGGTCAGVDADLDGHAATPCGDDCDDSDPTVFPGALDAAPDDEPWSLETVDAEGRSGFVTSIAVDRSGLPHVSYHSAPRFPDDPQEVRYARRVGASWSIETVASGDASPFFYTSLALDDQSRPHVAFCSTAVEYAQQIDGAFVVTPIAESRNGAASHCSIALDAAGDVHLAYHGDNTINYATDASGSWSTEQIGDAFFAGMYADVAVDQRGTVFVAYGATGLRVARKSAWRAWSIELVDPTPSSYSSIALDADGRPAVSYVAQAASDELRVARFDGEGWTIETVDAPPEQLGYTGLAIDARGILHVVYENFGDPPGGQLRYARRDSSGWSFEVPDPAMPGGSWASIAVGPNGAVHVAYLHAGPRDAYDLRWARRMVADGIDQDCDGTDG